MTHWWRHRHESARRQRVFDPALDRPTTQTAEAEYRAMSAAQYNR
jgi:hypothetical protein